MSNGRDSVTLNISSQSLQKIIVKNDSKELVEQAQSIGETLGKKLTTNQIRAIFGTVRQIEMNWDDTATAAKQADAQRQLILLKPKMAYRATKEGRQGQGLAALTEVLTEAIDLVVQNDATDQRERFGRFVDFFEAILAYHAVAGGR